MKKTSYREKTIQLNSIAKKAFENRIISSDVYDDLVARIQNNEFRITIVGEFSSGKSTLIDALIGQDILPHSTSETTATLTYIHSVEIGHPNENKAEIHFSDGTIELVDFSKLREYVTAFSKTVDVYSNIEYVDVFVHLDRFDNNVIIVDTPGLNGTNHYEDRTLQEISKADASIFVFSPSGIKATEQSFMKEELLKHQSSFFYVMNRIDDLRASEGETVEGKLRELSKDISKCFFDGKKEVTKIYGISALKALAAKDRKIKKLYVDDPHEITDKDRERFWNESRFEDFLIDLEDYLVTEKESVFINSLATQLSLHLEECLQQIEQRLVANSPKKELPAAAIIKDEINTAKSRFDNYEKGLEKNVNTRLDSVEQKLKSNLTTIVRSGDRRCEEVKKQIDSIKTIEEFYRVFGEDGSKSSTIVNSFYDRHFEQLRKMLSDEIAIVRNDMLLEIRKIIPNIANLKKSTIKSVNIGKQTYSYTSASNDSLAQQRVKECEERISQLEKERNRASREKEEIDNKHSTLKRQSIAIQNSISNINYRISSLGRRPDAKLVTRTRPVKVERSFFNPKRWFGDKYTTEEKSYKDYDYSEQKAYDQKRQELISEKSSLDNRLSAIRQQIENLPDMEYELRTIARKIERQLQEKDYQLNEIRKAKETQQKEMAAGREAFLNNRKRTLLNTLNSILTNGQSDLHLSLKNHSLKYLSELRGSLTLIIRNFFKEESDKYIQQLNIMLNNLSTSVENKEIEQKRNHLNVNKQKVIALIKELKTLLI